MWDLERAEMSARTEDLPLFAGPLASAHPMARTTDPDSSHAAADKLEASGTAQRQRDEALALVQRWPGMSANQLARLSRPKCPACTRNMLSRRLAELRTEGLVDCLRSGSRELRWYPR